jgi:hypothetical protein
MEGWMLRKLLQLRRFVARSGGLQSISNFSKRTVIDTKNYSNVRVEFAPFAVVPLVSGGGSTWTTIIKGWWYGVYFVSAVTGRYQAG